MTGVLFPLRTTSPVPDTRAISLTPMAVLTPDRLRGAAADLFSGAVTVIGAEPVWAVACVYLMRAALEAELDAFWARTMPEVAAAPRRAQLLVLPQVIDAGTARRVADLWGALSEATHHHSYDLPPNSAEIGAWTCSVISISAEFAERAATVGASSCPESTADGLR